MMTLPSMAQPCQRGRMITVCKFVGAPLWRMWRGASRKQGRINEHKTQRADGAADHGADVAEVARASTTSVKAALHNVLLVVRRCLQLRDASALQSRRRGGGTQRTHEPGSERSEPNVAPLTRQFRARMRLLRWLCPLPRPATRVRAWASGRGRGGAVPLAALSLTPMHSLRHRLVRSRQYASGSVLGFLRF